MLGPPQVVFRIDLAALPPERQRVSRSVQASRLLGNGAGTLSIPPLAT